MSCTEARSIRAAHKPHQCCWCWCIIRIGSPYLRSRGFDCADAWTIKVHVECQTAIDWAYGPGGVDEYDEVTDAYDTAVFLDTNWDKKNRRFLTQPATIPHDSDGAS